MRFELANQFGKLHVLARIVPHAGQFGCEAFLGGRIQYRGPIFIVG
jgi:hypothetical protein